jgi:hypothetical protein
VVDLFGLATFFCGGKNFRNERHYVVRELHLRSIESQHAPTVSDRRIVLLVVFGLPHSLRVPSVDE